MALRIRDEKPQCECMSTCGVTCHSYAVLPVPIALHYKFGRYWLTSEDVVHRLQCPTDACVLSCDVAGQENANAGRCFYRRTQVNCVNDLTTSAMADASRLCRRWIQNLKLKSALLSCRFHPEIYTHPYLILAPFSGLISENTTSFDRMGNHIRWRTNGQRHRNLKKSRNW